MKLFGQFVIWLYVLDHGCFGKRVNLKRQREMAVEWQSEPPGWASDSIGRLATSFLQIFSTTDSNNMVISPYGLWSVLLMIFQAADKETEREIQSQLFLPKRKKDVYDGYFTVHSTLLAGRTSSETVELTIKNFLVRNKTGTETRSKDFFSTLRNRYQVEVFLLASADPAENANAINQRISNLTQNHIDQVLNPSDLQAIQYLIGNVLYFRGHWLHPFNKNETFTDEFKNEQDKIIGHIPMMVQLETFPYGFSRELDSQLIEIPYADGKTSMIVILPRRKVSVDHVLGKMKNRTLTELLPDTMSNEEVELYLPKFLLNEDFNLNAIVKQMGIKRIFSPAQAELSLLANSTFISKIIQKVRLENDEEGTVASAATVAQVTYKTGSATFQANRPFIFLINDITSRVVLFSGLFRTP